MIGKRLKEIRKNKGITQEELASIINMQRSAISFYEHDKSEASDKNKVLIAKKLNISLDYLLGTIDEPVPFYTNNGMIIIPDILSNEEKNFILEYIAFIQCKKGTIVDNS